MRILRFTPNLLKMASSSPISETSTISPTASRSILLASSPISLDHHTLQITQHKLNGANFWEWSQSVMLVMKGKEKMRYLTGRIYYETWDAENSIVMTWLINSMEPKIRRTYLFYKTTKEV